MSNPPASQVYSGPGLFTSHRRFPGLRVQVIEDDTDLAHYITYLLRTRLGLETRHASDGFQGLQECLAYRPDLVTLDLELPTLRGEEVCRLLKSLPATSNIPIIVCSALATSWRQEMQLLGFGADAYIVKPFNEDIFLRTVEKLLITRDRTQADLPPTIREVAPGTNQASHNPEDFPESFAGFQLHNIIGAGAMGTVYRAKDPHTGKSIALKVLLQSLAGIRTAVERFLSEGRIMERLEHPNIVRIHGAGQTALTYYIAMEYIEGDTVAHLLETHRGLDWPTARRVILGLADALCYLHTQGVLHRDVKPSNILLSSAGDVKLSDFGIARDIRHMPSIQLTVDAARIGTPQFMAPEQLAGASATELTDQYSFGRTVLALFEGGTPRVPPVPLHILRPGLPRALSEIIARCMHVFPSERYPSMRAAREEIQQVLPEP